MGIKVLGREVADAAHDVSRRQIRGCHGKYFLQAKALLQRGRETGRSGQGILDANLDDSLPTCLSEQALDARTRHMRSLRDRGLIQSLVETVIGDLSEQFGLLQLSDHTRLRMEKRA